VRGGDRGAASVELAVLAPALLLVVALLIAAGRITLAGGAVEHAATAAARQASLARTPATARAAAEQTARRLLAEQHLHCRSTTVGVDTAGFAAPSGRPAQVSVQVACVVPLADLGLPGPGARTLADTFTSPLDPYRGR
jgi:Flp pilus assembly protein TadG